MEKKEILSEIIRSVVEKPEMVKVDVIDASSITVFKIVVDKGDVGVVIGKGGSFVSTLRTLAKTWSGKEKRKYFIDVVDSKKILEKKSGQSG